MAEVSTERMHTKREAAAALRVSEITVHRAIKDKRLGCYRIGSKVYVGQSHLDRFLGRCERRPKEAA